MERSVAEHALAGGGKDFPRGFELALPTVGELQSNEILEVVDVLGLDVEEHFTKFVHTETGDDPTAPCLSYRSGVLIASHPIEASTNRYGHGRDSADDCENPDGEQHPIAAHDSDERQDDSANGGNNAAQHSGGDARFTGRVDHSPLVVPVLMAEMPQTTQVGISFAARGPELQAMKLITTLTILGTLSVGAFAFPTLQLTGTGKGGNVKVSLNSGGNYNSFFAGEMKLKLNTGSSVTNFSGFCTDSDIHVSGSAWNVTITDTSNLDPNGARIANLVNTYLPGIIASGSNDQARALQLVIWELSEESSSTFDLTTGSFRAKSTDDGALSAGTLSAATTYLSNMGTSVAPFYMSGFNGNNQLSQNMVAPVPEPASMGALALGVIGLVRRRRNRR